MRNLAAVQICGCILSAIVAFPLQSVNLPLFGVTWTIETLAGVIITLAAVAVIINTVGFFQEVPGESRRMY